MVLEADNGTIDLFDLVFGKIENISDLREHFEKAVLLPENQENWLKSYIIQCMAAREKKRNPGQFYVFQIPLILGGKLIPDNVVIRDISGYYIGLSRVYQQVWNLPEGTKITSAKLEE
jgi:hypothetical protein